MGDHGLYNTAIKWINLVGVQERINRDGVAKLHRITINGSASGSIFVYNGPTVSHELVAQIDSSNVGTYEYGILLASGITVSGTAASNATVVYE